MQKQAPRKAASHWEDPREWLSQTITQPDATSFWAVMDVLRSKVPLSGFVARELLAVFLLLRWIDLQDAEQEAMAAFEDRSYPPLLPEALRWRHWARLDDPKGVSERLRDLTQYVEGLRDDEPNPLAHYLHALAGPIGGVLRECDDNLIDIVRWMDELPFETGSERSAVLDLFDQVLAETGDSNDSQFSTPPNIARLVVALANPQPGERVYDPCFGVGNFVVTAWRHAERSRTEQRRPGALLDVSGIEINPSAFLIGLTRMLLAGIERPRLELGDSLERELPGSPSRQGFDVVVADPPFGSSLRREPWRYQQFPILTSDSTGLFVQHVLSQLKPTGRAVIAVPEGFLFRGGAERELRRYLLEQGHVEAVVGLPAGAFAPYTKIKFSLLVLRKQGGASQVRMADASALFGSRVGRNAPTLSAEIAETLARELRRSELRKLEDRSPRVPEGAIVPSRSVWEVSVDDIAAAEWDLSPRRRDEGGLEEVLSNLKEVLGEAGSVAPLSSVAEVFAGRAIKTSDLTEDPPPERPLGYVRIKDLSKGKVDRVSRWLRPELASVEQRWALLPGDVLVSKSGTIGKAALVRNGAIGSVAANGLYVLRPDQEQLDGGFLLAYLASPACQNWLAARSRGAVI